MVPFRFDPVAHAYTIEGVRVPSITQLLKRAGLVDDTWYTDDARDRGTRVHDLTAAYDLGGLALEDVVGFEEHAAYLQHYVEFVKMVRPEWGYVEVPFVHEAHRFGGRPDRVGRVFAMASVVEIKSGAPEKAHAVQTALQAILVAPLLTLPPELIQRYVVYLTPEKFKVEHYHSNRDLDRARKVLRECSGG